MESPARETRPAGEVSDYRYRMTTYVNFPYMLDPCLLESLAKAGFYYTGIGKRLQCFKCHCTIESEAFGLLAIQEYARLYPSCELSRTQSLANNGSLDSIQSAQLRGVDSHRWSSGDQPALSQQGFHTTSYNPGHLTMHTYRDPAAVLPKATMKREDNRLKTFQSWPRDSPVSAAELAKAGFFFLGPSDRVQCFCCRGILTEWVLGDRPLQEHRKHFPNCEFVLGREAGNVPMVQAPRPTDAVDGQILGQIQRMSVEDVVLASQPVYPEMETEQTRLGTFQNWPSYASIQPELLARAGFFFTEAEGITQCFYCDGGLRNWEPNDDPWREHAKWFPRQHPFCISQGPGYPASLRKHVVSSEDLLSLLQSPMVQQALQMGFDRGAVESLIQSKYLLTGAQYASISELVSDLLQTGEQETGRTEVTGEPAQNQRPSETPQVRQEGVTVQPKEKVPEAELSTEEQLRRLQEERTCKVCMDKEVSIVFIPCGHLVVCQECAPSLVRCPICRSTIRGSVRTFMS
nr:PREDICTED: baculoviral IAP repeat-containing protein 7 [Latimeria chalumnae]|eukprot:XP_014342410.1 PREDICTED: baculoviral IAP repeat-containing protein 7 [Latimeria chalumnae]